MSSYDLFLYFPVSCYKCSYNKTGFCKKEIEKCVGDEVHCYDYHLNFMDSSQLIGKACSSPKYCEDKVKACEKKNKTHGYTIKECTIDCCNKNLCNFTDKASSLVFHFVSWLVVLGSLYLVT